MRLIIPLLFVSSLSSGQNLSFSPGAINENTVSLDYYNTEYIFITNLSANIVSLEFELVEENIPAEWAASGCTNVICYTSIPEGGSLGDLNTGGEAYFSINLSVNEVPGDAIIRYRIFDYNNSEINDTISFMYHVDSDTIISSAQPWAQINFYQNVLTTFLKKEFSGSVLSVFDMSGRQIIHQEIQEIAAISFKDFEAGLYIVSIENKSGQRITQKVFNGF